MERSLIFKKVRVYSKMLVALGLSSVLIGCAMNPSTETKTPNNAKNQVQTHERIQTNSEHVTPLDFNYPIHIAQAPQNHHIVGILAPCIQVSDNLKPYIDKFQDALANQIQTIFEKRGYQVLHFQDEKALSAQDKRKIIFVLDLKGWVGILEDLKMNVKDPNDPNLDALVDQSSGSVWFNFYEPESNRVVHDFAVEVGTFQAITYTYTSTNNASGGFNSSNSIIHENLDKNKEDAIHKILNKMYAVVMKGAVTELTEENIAKYRDAIDRMKGFKSSMPQKK
ncbi:HpaA family protein [Helicobacter pylori]|uniref:HpaA family protein n=1 Tax=Helicobacter pylori TaxID=210 RepID=UPI00025AC6AC|nr:neuraminyllactose-binding hemagglutinin [Helicobacter pylori]EIE30035.1 flagellar sheath adhesin [Helicobacter pylori NCTC 11637 = CCUG 17874 = ATCC 43504 = JCM 12093]MBM0602751.1 neuraminyllactose-binding hemagglutinin [Helicobacter pylori]MBM0610057.1 neuraminyllactose-binding hemagglutinin [Helicobacter pylori]MBM0619226.1 neuraminyllactose-binding hemagglutinin [Helicobacter pylori]MBM0626604.1 neuraminyllactose-binding hemagglutinin [Helicobacter pylori]